MPVTSTASATTAPTIPPTPTATSTPAPANLSAKNFTQFVQVQAFPQVVESLEKYGASIFSMRRDVIAFSPDGTLVALGVCTTTTAETCKGGGGESYFFILQAQTGEVIATLPETDVTYTSAVFTPDNSKLIYATSPLSIVVWDIATGTVERLIVQQTRGGFSMKIALSPDGRLLAGADQDSLRVWDFDSGSLLAEKPGLGRVSIMPQFNGDGSRLATFTQRGGRELAVYETSTWQLISAIQPPTSEVSDAALSPDGRTLATVGLEDDNAQIILWDVDSGTQAVILQDIHRVTALAFSPDGQLLLTSGYSQDLEYGYNFSVWDVVTRQRLGAMIHSDEVDRIIFSSQGISFLTTRYYPDVYIWSLPGEKDLAVRQALVDFHAALNRGDYNAALALFRPWPEELDFYASKGFDTSSLPDFMEAFCLQEYQPCMPIRSILYQGMTYQGDYELFVQYTTPSGAIFEDADGNDFFYRFAEIDQDGLVKVNLMPPAYTYQ